jgi:YihY family inner membrane protein
VNPIGRGLHRLDRAQQRHTPSACAVGVVRKYADDNGGALAGNLAHSAFVSVFPLLLVLVTILGLVSSLDPALRGQVENAVNQQFPLVGQQLTGNVDTLRRSSVIGLVIGFLGLLWGSTRLARAAQFTMAQVWNLPGPARPSYLHRLGRSLLFLGVLGIGVAATTLITGLGLFGRHIPGLVVLTELLAAVVNIGLYFIGFRVLTARGVPSRALLPGAVAGGVAWTVLQLCGGYLMHHYLHSDSAYNVFATVLGLVAWLYLTVQVTVFAAEVNVVLARRLWPRTIAPPPLTEADRASMTLQALQNQRRPEQHVRVTFDDRPPGVRGDRPPGVRGDRPPGVPGDRPPGVPHS